MRKLYEPKARPMSVALFMSGSGTDAVSVLEAERTLRKGAGAPFAVTAICTDNTASNAAEVGRRFGVAVFTHDLEAFCKELGTVRRDRSVRPAYFTMVMDDLKAHGVEPDLIVLAGYMVLAAPPLLGDLAVNVHPADLSIRDSDGKAVYTGANAVRDALLDGRDEIRASTHMVTEEMDQGHVLMVSAPVKVELPQGFDRNDSDMVREVSEEHKESLKRIGDWVILPKTVTAMAAGSFALDGDGVMCYRGAQIPRGYDFSIGAPR